MSFLSHFHTLIVTFGDAILQEDFVLAQQRLNALSTLVGANWQELGPEEREKVHADVMGTLQWAKGSVCQGRARRQSQLDQIQGAKVYQMPDPSERWNLQG